nr:MAG TPA: hypothetical protein [Caudoviricetes sp.]
MLILFMIPLVFKGIAKAEDLKLYVVLKKINTQK